MRAGSCLLLFCAALFFASPGSAQSRASGGFPPVVLWAWERREDLRFLAGKNVGVAYLGATVRLEGLRWKAVPRFQPLLVDSRTPLAAVIRLETSRKERPGLSSAQRNEVVATALRLERAPGVSVIQIDSDATVSERPFYRQLLSDLRRRLGRETRLSFTALASWCMGDGWLAGLPVDEVVPMLFEMGPDGPEIRRTLERGQDFTSAACRMSLGLSLSELFSPRLSRRRVYFFSREAWTRASYERAVETLGTGSRGPGPAIKPRFERLGPGVP